MSIMERTVTSAICLVSLLVVPSCESGPATPTTARAGSKPSSSQSQRQAAELQRARDTVFSSIPREQKAQAVATIVSLSDRGYAPAQALHGVLLATEFNAQVILKRDLSKARAVWQAASQQGIALAMYYLAITDFSGTGWTPPSDYAQLIERAAERGSLEARLRLATDMVFGTRGITPDLPRARALLAEVKAGKPFGKDSPGDIALLESRLAYLDGGRSQEGVRAGLVLAEPFAATRPWAKALLAEALWSGTGRAADRPRAVVLFEELQETEALMSTPVVLSRDSDYVRDMRRIVGGRLALASLLGEGRERDLEVGLRRLRAVETGKGELALEAFRELMEGPNEFRSGAVEVLRVCREARHPEGTFELARIVHEGRLCAADVGLAKEILRDASEFGHADATFILAEEIFASGDTELSSSSNRAILERAGAAGDSRSARAVARHTIMNGGDPAAAAQWYEFVLAAEPRDSEAHAFLGRVHYGAALAASEPSETTLASAIQHLEVAAAGNDALSAELLRDARVDLQRAREAKRQREALAMETRRLEEEAAAQRRELARLEEEIEERARAMEEAEMLAQMPLEPIQERSTASYFADALRPALDDVTRTAQQITDARIAADREVQRRQEHDARRREAQARFEQERERVAEARRTREEQTRVAALASAERDQRAEALRARQRDLAAHQEEQRREARERLESQRAERPVLYVGAVPPGGVATPAANTATSSEPVADRSTKLVLVATGQNKHGWWRAYGPVQSLWAAVKTEEEGLKAVVREEDLPNLTLIRQHGLYKVYHIGRTLQPDDSDIRKRIGWTDD